MWTTIFLALNYVVAWTVVLRVLTRQRMEPSVRIAWIMVVEAVPFVGILAYLLFGEVRIAHAERQRAQDIRARLSGMWVPSPSAVTDPPEWIAGITATVQAVGGMVPVAGNRLRLLAETDDGFDAMIDAIDAARDHVHVLFYIWIDDTSGRRVAAAFLAQGLVDRIMLFSSDVMVGEGGIASPVSGGRIPNGFTLRARARFGDDQLEEYMRA